VKKLFLFIFLTLIVHTTYAQKYWQQQVNFNISVSLNDDEHTLTGVESIEYINNSPDTLRYIWFHLWPNAYKNDRTAFSEQMLKNGSTKFYYSKPEDKGYINRLDFKVNNTSLTTEATAANIDVVKVNLSEPLFPGKKTTITTTFHVKLPYNFSRGGHIGQDYQVTQWYPKPAVYDRKGWHPMPYVDQGEFYSEFGNYDVEINLPASYLVAATGILQDATTLKEIKEKGKHTVSEGKKLWHFKQINVHDFAWFASKEFIAQYDTVKLASNKIVDVFSFYKPDSKDGWKQSVTYAKRGIVDYSNWIGDYPYSIATVVQGSKNENSGGMEYPTITLITTEDDKQELDATIVHEIGHNWFYGALASNERQHPWMDEGMNTFYQKKYEDMRYGTYSYLKDVPKSFAKKLPDDEEEILLKTMQSINRAQPIETPSEEFSQLNYGLIAYINASRWMKKLERTLGEELFAKAMKEYYNTWKFRHPYPEDFRASIEKTAGRSLELFDELHQSRIIETTPKKNVKPTLFFNLNNTDKTNYINILPAIGYNNYDKGMIGMMAHNYQLPVNKFKFIAGGLYSTGSKNINPFGRASYSVYKKNYKLEPAVSFIKYSQNEFINNDNAQDYLSIRRIVPSLNFTLHSKDQTLDKRFNALFKTFLLKEDVREFKTIIAPPDTFDVVNKVPINKTINRLSLSYSDSRILFPYTFNLTTDQGNGFIRSAFTANYFFNYADNKGGMKARLFAGKFFYTTAKTTLQQFATEDYHLNMTGANGQEDYTYSDYFIGRNEFTGWKSQQIMERDGFFKVRTDLLGEKIGKTDDWLLSLNLVSDVPKNINPLSVLPFKIPIKVFADIGTYAEAWQQETSTGRFLYDAGIQVSLFSSMVNVYLPLLYSQVYSSYFKSTLGKNRFVKTISFNIDLQQLKFNKLLPGIPL
jgi:hypothetical protein